MSEPRKEQKEITVSKVSRSKIMEARRSGIYRDATSIWILLVNGSRRLRQEYRNLLFFHQGLAALFVLYLLLFVGP